jgi:adenylate cyclase
MADDEAFTIQTLKAYRKIMSELIGQHNGRVVDSPGDNILAEFSSAVDAVEAAVQIQNRLKKDNARFVEKKRLEFRIGVNVGDVVQDGDRIYGSGVNVASRIEGISKPGGICISRGTYDQVKDKVDLDFDYMGEHAVKNIKEPIRVYRVLMDTESHVPLVEKELELPDKPSIAVLPFTNMSGDPSQEYFSDGLTEQIINGLCKVPNLFVIARNSSFAYKGKAVSVKYIAKELGVQYILEGSVQRAGDRVRITAQLIDATTDYHMWSENYDRSLEDIFELQDEITMKLISAMQVKLTFGEQALIWEGGTKNVQAYDNWARSLECIYQRTEQSISQAKKFAEKAIDLDPKYAFAYIALAYAHFIDLIWGFSKSPLVSFEQVEILSKKALDLNDSLDYAHSLSGIILLFKRQYDEAIKEGKRAVQLNPNGADVLAQLGLILNYSGKPEQAIPVLERAMRLNPIPPSHFYTHLSISYRLVGKYEDSIRMCKKAISIEPNDVTPYVSLVASAILFGQHEDAHNAANKILKINPDFSPVEFLMKLPYKERAELERIIEALRTAGLRD